MPTYQDLLENNEHFYECLKELAHNILHFAFSTQTKLSLLPNNFIGYYEIAKNLVHSEDVLPQTVKVFIQSHILRLLFIEFSILEFRNHFVRYEGSALLNLFMK